MTRLLKHGTVLGPKIKYIANILALFSVVSAWLLSFLACSEDYISAIELTATASNGQSGVSSITRETALTSPVQPTETYPMLQEPTETPLIEELPTNDQPAELSDVTPTLTPVNSQKPDIVYHSQSGDSLDALAKRFGVSKDEITSESGIPSHGYINPGQILIIPDRLENTGPPDKLLPDSEIIYSPSTIGFDTAVFVADANGQLSSYTEYRINGWNTGAEIVEIIGIDNSINPRFLLALLEYQSNWVYGQPTNIAESEYPVGWIDLRQRGLYFQLKWAIQQLSIGYYGWRNGDITQLEFPDGSLLRIAPELNAGSVAIQYLFSKLYYIDQWYSIFYDPNSFLEVYSRMFGDPWERAQLVEPLFPPDFTQPPFELPFPPGHSWNYTGGPHAVWGPDSASAALDFAPIGTNDCSESEEWISASYPGLVVRSGHGVVMVDIDGDGFEQNGWDILYLHVASRDRVPIGTYLQQNDHIGHPSCEGGVSTGTHLHIARKYNGEWILAGGPMPFELSGWQAHNGSKPYEGTLSKNDQIIKANVYSSYETLIIRPAE